MWPHCCAGLSLGQAVLSDQVCQLEKMQTLSSCSFRGSILTQRGGVKEPGFIPSGPVSEVGVAAGGNSRKVLGVFSQNDRSISLEVESRLRSISLFRGGTVSPRTQAITSLLKKDF